jgi:subtilase family serine protease
MLGDPMTGFLVGQTDPMTGQYGEYAIGGTSLACPLFVGVMALAQQHAGHTLGFANAQLYALKKGAFHDVVPPSTPQAVVIPGGVVTTINNPTQTINTAVGYDTITGLGSPNGATFINAIK